MPALYKPRMGRFMRHEEALCNLSFTCQLLLFFSLGGEEAERLRTETSAMLPSRRVTLHESTTLGLMVKGEHRRDAGRTSKESLRRQRGLQASFTSSMVLPETDPASGQGSVGQRKHREHASPLPVLQISLLGLHRAFLDLKAFS